MLDPGLRRGGAWKSVSQTSSGVTVLDVTNCVSTISGAATGDCQDRGHARACPTAIDLWQGGRMINAMPRPRLRDAIPALRPAAAYSLGTRSEEHTSELQSLMRISYAVFCLKKKNLNTYIIN